MIVLLIGVLALAVGGCVCVVWAQRGGPRWVRAVATVTLAAGKMVRRSKRYTSPGLNRSTGDGD
ncbi:hypothetical protein QIT00_29680 [Streptomyces sp. B-S-A12]|uniref:Secreted protein n=2 Tax=Streptomyces luteolus TaxID=3043615 RepID=A0ABT6T6K1_9ACTN|nr:hypothetical protein [Streptomyces sp. B-S-A12]MDI3422664.1 hypothetical protein [Streptomyces sp. B-S-A12]